MANVNEDISQQDRSKDKVIKTIILGLEKYIFDKKFAYSVVEKNICLIKKPHNLFFFLQKDLIIY